MLHFQATHLNLCIYFEFNRYALCLYYLVLYTKCVLKTWGGLACLSVVVDAVIESLLLPWLLE